MLKGTVPKAFRQRKGHCARFLLAPNSIKQVKERGKRESNAKKKSKHAAIHRMGWWGFRVTYTGWKPWNSRRRSHHGLLPRPGVQIATFAASLPETSSLLKLSLLTLV
jgi:hypothetical protein